MPKHLLRNNQQLRSTVVVYRYNIIQTQNFSKLEEKIPLFMEAVDNYFQCLM
jgi:hypothetical protein